MCFGIFLFNQGVLYKKLTVYVRGHGVAVMSPPQTERSDKNVLQSWTGLFDMKVIEEHMHARANLLVKKFSATEPMIYCSFLVISMSPLNSTKKTLEEKALEIRDRKSVQCRISLLYVPDHFVIYRTVRLGVQSPPSHD